jgi:hypothetical protein
MRSMLSTPEASLDSLDALDVVTSVVAIRDQGVDGIECGPVWPADYYARR